MQSLIRFFIVLSVALVPLGTLVAQDIPSTLDEARSLYASGNFSQALDLLVQASPSANPTAKGQLSDRLMDMADGEYGRKNFKNAYAAVRAALKTWPTNQPATKLFLKIRGEMDVNRLTNASDSVQAPADLALADPSGAVAVPRSAAPSAPVQTPKAVTKAPVAVPVGASAAPGPDSQEVQQILGLLSDIAQKQAAPGPEVERLLSDLGAKIERANNPLSSPLFLLVLLVSVILAVLGTVLVGVLLSRRRVRAAMVGSPQTEVLWTSAPRRAKLNQTRNEPIPVAVAEEQELAFRKDWLRVERLSQLQDELRRGGDRWEIVKAHLDDLDASLKAEILSVVEDKLNTGDLASKDAILPILFPFLTEHDDFFREKAERLTQSVLPVSRDRGGEADTLDRECLLVPEQLKDLLKGRDRSVLTAKLTKAVAKRLGLSVETREKMYQGALIHDAGYLLLDPHELQRILGKDEITDDEFAVIQSHVSRGPTYFESLNLTLADEHRQALLFHHERMDGGGYPDGLQGEAIPLVARIIAVCETFVALLSSRPYRPKVDLSQALAIIQDGAGTQFDRQVVQAFVVVIRATGSL